MELIKVREVIKNYTTSQTVENRSERCGGYEAVNIGTSEASVNGYTIYPGEGVSRLEGVGRVLFDSDIMIEITPGAIVRLTRMIYFE